MRAVVDTNVVAYYLVGNHRSKRKRSASGRASLGSNWRHRYDTLFVELAERARAPLATFAQRLLKTWQAIAPRLGEITGRYQRSPRQL